MDAYEQKECLCNVFVDNGYPEEITKKCLYKKKSKRGTHKTKNVEKIDTLCLPYMQDLSERVERAVKDDKVRLVFKTTLTLRHCLTKVKLPTDLLRELYIIFRATVEKCICLRLGET